MRKGTSIGVAVAVGVGIGVAIKDPVAGMATAGVIAILLILFGRLRK
ncbi:hypothetical protein HK107_09775 [Parvularcula sp. ZS-1/3]|uniref:Uncharacterized protein n=1 Tax=Parvularcula mediterranea TaxID=2732508 RepID=A0A7Y3RM43_9PROT|nr:hypothetical protein [Parvularcula mediterranea]NNU16608.1 hypothetical protein [Parvularcula mediterranea]